MYYKNGGREFQKKGLGDYTKNDTNIFWKGYKWRKATYSDKELRIYGRIK